MSMRRGVAIDFFSCSISFSQLEDFSIRFLNIIPILIIDRFMSDFLINFSSIVQLSDLVNSMS